MYSLKCVFEELEKYVLSSKAKDRNGLLFFRDNSFSRNQINLCENLMRTIWEVLHPKKFPIISSETIIKKQIYTLICEAFEYSKKLQEHRIYDENISLSDGGWVGHSTFAFSREQFREQCSNGWGTGLHGYLFEVVSAFEHLNFVLDIGIKDKAHSLTEDDGPTYMTNLDL